MKTVNNQNLLGAGVAISIAMAAWLPTTATAADEPMKPMKAGEHQSKAGGAQMEAGSATIDVSAYPKTVQPTTAPAAGESKKTMEGGEPQSKAGSAQMEAGPATIDVSGYPKAVQDTYLLFTEKCAQCHHLNHTINSDHHALPDEWKGIVNRMWRKPGSNINNTEARQILEFLTYDSSVRRKAAVDEMLAKATPREKKADEDKIKEVHAKYDQH